MIETFVVDKYLDDKLKEDYIEGKVYEIRVEHAILEQDINEFLRYVKIKIEKNDYQVYFTGEKFKYNDRIITVQSNDYFIAIKNKRKRVIQDESSKGISNGRKGIIKKHRNKY